MYINKVFLYGNITRDPELKSLPSGSQVCEFSIATNRVWKDKNGAKQESADYHNIVVFGRQAEIVKQYLAKGSAVFAEGRIQTRSWEAQDGTKKYRTEIIAERIQFGPKSGGSSYSNQTQDSSTTTSSSNSKDSKEEVPTIDYPEEEINADDIPF